jgi:hypothetical protein
MKHETHHIRPVLIGHHCIGHLLARPAAGPRSIVMTGLSAHTPISTPRHASSRVARPGVEHEVKAVRMMLDVFGHLGEVRFTGGG